MYNDSNKPYFKDLADYRNRNTEPVALEAAKRCAQKLYGLDSNHEHNLAENKFLKEFSFIDEDLRLINNDGKLVDREGNLVNEDGRYIDGDGNLVDVDGNPVTVEGEYDFERQPFLNEDGKPIESKETDSEPEPEEEAKVEDTGDEVEAEAEAEADDD